MLKKTVAVFVVLCGVISFSGCFSILNFRPGNSSDFESFDDLDGFNGIRAGDAVTLKISKGNDYEVSAVIDEDERDFWDIRVIGKTLSIRSEKSLFRNLEPIEVTVVLPELTDLDLSGAVTAHISSIWAADRIDISLSGGSRIIGEGGFMAGYGRIDLSGASYCRLQGQIDELFLDLGGASIADLEKMQSRSVDADVSGASRARICALKSLDCDLSGASSLSYAGNPEIGNLNLSGVSSFSRL